MLRVAIKHALVDVVRRFNDEDVDYCVGGSVMLALRGIDVTVGDLDFVVNAADRDAVERVFPDRVEREQTDLWRSAWSFRAEWPVRTDTLGVDVMGDMSVIIDGGEAVFPVTSDESVALDGVIVKLAPLRHWYHLYRMHKPGRAQLAANLLDDDEIIAGARELGIADRFSPTLIVRIGNETRAQDIEQDMSTEQQSSIIQVASPTDHKFDDPASTEIDLDLLNETLEYVRPALQADGGDLVLLGTEGGKVILQMVGACGGCPLSTMTLTAGIERIVQDRVPGVTEVVSV